MGLKNKTKYSTLIEWSGFLSPRSKLSKIEFFDIALGLSILIQNLMGVISKGNLFKC